MRKTQTLLFVAAAAVFALLMVGCGSSSDSSSSTETGGSTEASSQTTSEETDGSTGTAKAQTVDLGGSKPIKVGGEPLNMAFFMANTNTPYAAAIVSGAEEAAEAAGSPLTVYDANFDPVKQTQQMETALASGKFNAWMIASISPQGCTILKKAIAADIPVSVINQQVCKPLTSFGEAAWYPGSVNFVGGDQTEMIPEYLEKIVEENPGKQKMLFLTGPPGLGQTTIAEETVKKIGEENPEFEIVSNSVATYDLAGAKEEMESMLSANKDATIVSTLYSDMTQGAVLALEQSGIEGVKVYDTGNSKWANQAVQDGTIEFTTPNLPSTEGGTGIESLVSTWNEAEPGPHYVNVLDVAGFGKDIFITKENAAEAEPEF